MTEQQELLRRLKMRPGDVRLPQAVIPVERDAVILMQCVDAPERGGTDKQQPDKGRRHLAKDLLPQRHLHGILADRGVEAIVIRRGCHQGATGKICATEVPAARLKRREREGAKTRRKREESIQRFSPSRQ